MKNKLLYQKLIGQERYRDKMRRIGEYKFTTRCNFHKTIYQLLLTNIYIL